MTATPANPQIKALAEDIKLGKLFLVGCKAQGEKDRGFIQEDSPGLAVLGYLPDDPMVCKADRDRVAVYDLAPALVAATEEMIDSLKAALG